MAYAELPENLQVFYEDDDFTDPWKKPEAIILQHGNSKNTRLWYKWVPLLAADYRVIRVDARGFGRSSVPPAGYGWSLEGFARDIRNLMDYLDIEKAHLVGETVGGTFALQFAHDFPNRLHTVTACSSPYSFRGEQRYLDFYNLVKEKGVEAWVRQTSTSRLPEGTTDAGHREWYVQQMARTNQRVVMESLAYLATVDLTGTLPEIKVPALVLVGADAGESTVRARKMASLLGNGRVVEVLGVSGFVQHEAPEQCVKVWREFVQNV